MAAVALHRTEGHLAVVAGTAELPLINRVHFHPRPVLLEAEDARMTSPALEHGGMELMAEYGGMKAA